MATNSNSSVELLTNKTVNDKLRVTNGDSSGSPGSATINAGAGKFAIAQGAATATITNSLCRSTSIVLAAILSNDSTLTSLNVVPGNGSFVATGNGNANADCTVGFLIVS